MISGCFGETIVKWRFEPNLKKSFEKLLTNSKRWVMIETSRGWQPKQPETKTMFQINIAPSPFQVAKMWPRKNNNIVLSQMDLAWIKAGMANWDAYASYKPKSI